MRKGTIKILYLKIATGRAGVNHRIRETNQAENLKRQVWFILWKMLGKGSNTPAIVAAAVAVCRKDQEEENPKGCPDGDLLPQGDKTRQYALLVFGF